MLGDSDVYATIAISDLERAKVFYGETLGLTQLAEFPGGAMYQSNTSKLLIYESEFAGTNHATYAGWNVQDIEAEVIALKKADVVFEQYPDMPDVTLQGDVHVMGEYRSAWFKDPDGNILAINQMP